MNQRNLLILGHKVHMQVILGYQRQALIIMKGFLLSLS
jgi:hypothetical protein